MINYLSSEVLAQRLKELEVNKLIEKKVISTTPMVVDYHLTAKGLDLNKIVYEIAQFGYKNDKVGTANTCPIEVKKTIGIKGRFFVIYAHDTNKDNIYIYSNILTY